MKLYAETSHEIKLRATPENGDAYEASMFIKPHITVDCPALWNWLKEKLGIQETCDDDDGSIKEQEVSQG